MSEAACNEGWSCGRAEGKSTKAGKASTCIGKGETRTAQDGVQRKEHSLEGQRGRSASSCTEEGEGTTAVSPRREGDIAMQNSGPGWTAFLSSPSTSVIGLPHRRAASTSVHARTVAVLTAQQAPPKCPGSKLFSAVSVDGEEGKMDDLWWAEGSSVQSLQIACRDAKGDVLDPWRLSELLMDVGAMSVSVDDSSLGTEDESPILQDHSNSKAFDPSVPAPSVTGRKDMWGGSSRVVALFPGEWDLKGVVKTVEEVFDLTIPLAFKAEAVVDKDWVKTVQEGWDPIDVGRLRIRFPWHETLSPSEQKPNQVELELEGGRAFGTGEHPTTSMCCLWLEEVVSGQRVLDYGSGSGILGLAALSFGAKEAVGIELDLSAIASAAVNAARNGLHMDTYYPHEVGAGEDLDLMLTKLAVNEHVAKLLPIDGSSAGAMEPLSVADGSAFPAKELGTFDVTVANILAEPIMRLEPVFAHFTRPGGRLALSGVLEKQANSVLEAYRGNFELAVTESMGGWVLISGVRRGDSYDDITRSS